MKNRIAKFIVLIHVIAPALLTAQPFAINLSPTGSLDNFGGDPPYTAWLKQNANNAFFATGPTNGQTAAQVLSAIATNAITPGRNGGLIWYLAPWGSDATNNGLTANTPFANLATAITNTVFGDTLHICTGTNFVPFDFVLSNGVNMEFEANAWLAWTNNPSGEGTTTHALFYPYGNNVVNNANIACLDLDTVQVALGFGSSDTPVSGHTNIVFNNLNMVTYGVGIHIEGTVSTSSLLDYLFVGPHIVANACAVDEVGFRNPHIKIVGGDLTVQNFTNVAIGNAKPLRVVDVGTTATSGLFTNALEMRATSMHLSDADLSASNRPGFFEYNDTVFVKSNMASFVACTADWISEANVGSRDFGTNASAVNVTACARTDGMPFNWVLDMPNFGYQTNHGNWVGNFTNTLPFDVMLIDTNAGASSLFNPAGFQIYTNVNGGGAYSLQPPLILQPGAYVTNGVTIHADAGVWYSL